jgi:hypothetical protein
MEAKTENKLLDAAAAGFVVVGGIVFVAIIAVLTGLYWAWILMLLIGTLHHNFFPELFPYGYWVCFWPAVLLRMFFSSTQTNTNSKSQ